VGTAAGIHLLDQLRAPARRRDIVFNIVFNIVFSHA
jgi:hypothetical protein